MSSITSVRLALDTTPPPTCKQDVVPVDKCALLFRISQAACEDKALDAMVIPDDLVR